MEQNKIQVFNNAEFGNIRSKEVTSLRYNEKGKAKIREILKEQ